MSASPRFVRPCVPTAVKLPPKGDLWLHEAKLDGWRIQIAKEGRRVRLLSRSGADLTKRLGRLATELEALPVRSAVIDGELVLADERGAPNFYALQSALSRGCDGPFSVFVFDMMHKNGADLRALPLVKRKKRLAAVIGDAVPAVQFVDMFDDGATLLASCAKMGLEGIVSKRRDAPYRSGPSRDWVKVKTAAWHEANRERHKLFERG